MLAKESVIPAMKSSKRTTTYPAHSRSPAAHPFGARAGTGRPTRRHLRARHTVCFLSMSARKGFQRISMQKRRMEKRPSRTIARAAQSNVSITHGGTTTPFPTPAPGCGAAHSSTYLFECSYTSATCSNSTTCMGTVLVQGFLLDQGGD